MISKSKILIVVLLLIFPFSMGKSFVRISTVTQLLRGENNKNLKAILGGSATNFEHNSKNTVYYDLGQEQMIKKIEFTMEERSDKTYALTAVDTYLSASENGPYVKRDVSCGFFGPMCNLKVKGKARYVKLVYRGSSLDTRVYPKMLKFYTYRKKSKPGNLNYTEQDNGNFTIITFEKPVAFYKLEISEDIPNKGYQFKVGDDWKQGYYDYKDKIVLNGLSINALKFRGRIDTAKIKIYEETNGEVLKQKEKLKLNTTYSLDGKKKFKVKLFFEKSGAYTPFSMQQPISVVAESTKHRQPCDVVAFTTTDELYLCTKVPSVKFLSNNNFDLYVEFYEAL